MFSTSSVQDQRTMQIPGASIYHSTRPEDLNFEAHRTPREWWQCQLDKITAFSARLQRGYSKRFLIHLAGVYLGLKGVVATAVRLAQLPLLRSLGVSSSRYTQLLAATRLTWVVRGAAAIASDMYTFGGYHKRYRMAVASLGCLVALLCLGLAPFGERPQGLVPPLPDDALATLCFIFAGVGVVINEILCQGKVGDIMSSYGGSTSVVPYMFGCMQLGSLAMAAAAGLLIDRYGSQALMLAAAPFAAASLLFAISGSLPEAKAEKRCRCTVDWEHRGFCRLALQLSVASAAVALVLLAPQQLADMAGFEKPHLQVCVCFVALAFVAHSANRALPKIMFRCCIYMYCARGLHLGVQDMLDYWYTASADCRSQMLRGSPGFSMNFYYVYAGIVESLSGLLAVFAFDRILLQTSIRRAFWVPALLRVLAALFDVAVVQRSTVGHISDEVVYLIGTACKSFSYTLELMPGIALVGQLVLPDVESTMFAAFYGFVHLGESLGSILGGLLAEELGVHLQDSTVKVNCNDENFSVVVLVGHVLLPSLALPIACFLLPERRLNADFQSRMAPGLSTRGSTDPLGPPPAIELQDYPNWALTQVRMQRGSRDPTSFLGQQVQRDWAGRDLDVASDSPSFIVPIQEEQEVNVQ